MKVGKVAGYAVVSSLVAFANLASVYADDMSTGDKALPIAVQMYTLRNFGSLDEQLAIVQNAGLSAVELVGTHGLTAGELAEMLDARGLRAISAHVDIDELRHNLGEVVDFNRTLDNETITVPYLSERDRPRDAEGWTQLGEELEKIAAQLETEGLRLAYHNHDLELVDFDGRTGLELIFEAAPSVLAQLDVGWIDRAGHDPEVFVSRLAGRLFAIHAKDNAPTAAYILEWGWAPVGAGKIDWEHVLPAAQRSGAEWYIIEHDNPLDGAATVEESAEFLRRLLPKAADL